METIASTAVADLERNCASRFGRRRAVAVGRATWAIALVLEALKTRARRRIVALPSFLCHTPLAGVVHAGWKPLFCDVDPATGHVPHTEWATAVEKGAEVVLFVHLFGNPADPAPTESLCRNSGVFMIEDACQALGAATDGRPCGSFGDASILSFGHTKMIDVGGGGLLLSDDPALAEAVARSASRHTYMPAPRYRALSGEFLELFYSRKQRLLTQPAEPLRVLSDLIEHTLPLVPARWEADAVEISRQLDRLEEMSAQRRRKAALYAELLSATGIVPVGMGRGSAPWRFCFRMPGISRSRQEALSSAVRAKGVHISNWYLPAHWMMPAPQLATGGLDGTLELSSEIFQLWLDADTDESRIRANAQAFHEALTA